MLYKRDRQAGAGTRKPRLQRNVKEVGTVKEEENTTSGIRFSIGVLLRETPKDMMEMETEPTTLDTLGLRHLAERENGMTNVYSPAPPFSSRCF